MKNFLLLVVPLLLWSFGNADGQDATWNLNPVSNDWNTPANWTPAMLPTGTATLDVSNTTNISISAGRSIENIVFNPGASAFTISTDPAVQQNELTFTIQGDGITNNSGSSQQIVSVIDSAGNSSTIAFSGHAAITGSPTIFTTEGHPTSYLWGSVVYFSEGTNAGNGTFYNNGASVDRAAGGLTTFGGTASGGNGTFITNGGTVSGAGGGGTNFSDNSDASDAVIIGNGGTVTGAGGAVIGFGNHASLGNATIIANGGVNGGGGAGIWFGDYNSAAPNTARVELFGNGIMYVEMADSKDVAIGSLEGDGIVALGNKELSVGNNDLDTIFSGVIEGVGSARALTKVGAGTLTLAGANTYTGRTTVTSGALVVANATGSATGTSEVQVSGGTLGGKGSIDGDVSVGTANGAGSNLAPGIRATTFPALRIQGSLVFRADATYRCRLSTRKITNDKVLANGVTIESGAQFDFTQVGRNQLAMGTAFILIGNRSADPITGTFANLPDSFTFTAGRNNYQVSYEGGTGNDLTLTVVPQL